MRHDLVDAGWRARGVLRTLVQLAPAAGLLALLPGPWYLHVMLPVLVLVCGLFVAAAYGDDLRDRRLRQHGLAPPRRDDPPRGF